MSTLQPVPAPECVWDAQAAVGDGPVWSVHEQALYWVDIQDSKLHRYGPERRQQSWPIASGISAAAEREHEPGLLITTRHGFAFFNPENGQFQQLAEPEADIEHNRFNDGKCDAEGRFWAGTMDAEAKQSSGALYRLTADLTCSKMDTNYTISNGPTWSLDDATMYHSDSANGQVYAFDFDVAHGELSNKRVFLQFSDLDGSPDGMTTDAEGGVWIAHWGAGKVTRHDPAGKILHTVTVPCSQVSSCAFGGPYLRTLFITTAAAGLSTAQRAREPLAGGLFAMELEVAGLPPNRFAG